MRGTQEHATTCRLTVLFAAFTIIGRFANRFSFGWHTALRLALAGILWLTASAHWGKGRPDLIRMVPPALPLPCPNLLVTLTGVCESLGPIGLMIPSVAPTAPFGLSLMLLAMFPANAHAARERLAIGGRPVTLLRLRAAIQVVCLCDLVRPRPGSRPHPLTEANKCFIHMFETI